ncbi:MAG: DNA primase [Candidatus Uhrbacteria bacterium]
MDPKEEIRQRVDIVEFIGETLQLKPAGGGSFKALCPFHMEKTPSLYVSREKQIWHCFGCGEGHDIFDFVMKMEGVDFSEALRSLAKRAGVEVPRYNSTQTNENDRLIRVNEFAAACYQKILAESPSAAEARVYVEQRGITPDLLEKFGLGFAPEAWDTLVGLLNKKSIPLKEAERAGLALPRRSGDGYVDRFRHRLMIPLRDVRGQTVAFTGRIMPGAKDNEGPKYLNSPETPIYHKSELLFGLDLAKKAIKLEKSVIIVEGNLDVVASHKAGVENVVASSGTALTEQQLDILKRLTETLIFSFDQDAAGFNAALRGIRLARQKGFQIKVALLPPEAGKDPDEAVQKNPELWRQTVKQTIPVMDYIINRTIKDKDLSQVEVKKEVGEILLPELAIVPNVIEREHWLQTIADLLRLDIKILRNNLSSWSGVKKNEPIATPQNRSDPPSPGYGGHGRISYTAPKSDRRITLAAELILGLFTHLPALQKDHWSKLKEELLPEGELRELYRFFNSGYTYDRFLPETFPSYFDWLTGVTKETGREALFPLVMRLGLQGETLASELTAEQIQVELLAQLKILEADLRATRRRSLEIEIRRAEARGDLETVSKLMREFQNLN